MTTQRKIIGVLLGVALLMGLVIAGAAAVTTEARPGAAIAANLPAAVGGMAITATHTVASTTTQSDPLAATVQAVAALTNAVPGVAHPSNWGRDESSIAPGLVVVVLLLVYASSWHRRGAAHNCDDRNANTARQPNYGQMTVGTVTNIAATQVDDPNTTSGLGLFAAMFTTGRWVYGVCRQAIAPRAFACPSPSVS